MYESFIISNYECNVLLFNVNELKKEKKNVIGLDSIERKEVQSFLRFDSIEKINRHLTIS